MITGCVGGVLRDVLCNEIPLLFSSELYATVSIVIGAVYFSGLSLGLPHDAVTVVAFFAGFPLRILAILYKWQMPKFIFDKDAA